MSLNYQIKLVANRAERFEELKKIYSENQKITGGFETNDLGSLQKGLYQNYWKKIQIPKKLVSESSNLLNERDAVEFYLFRSKNETEKIQNKQRILNFFTGCGNVEKKLHKILLDYKKKNYKTK